MAHTYIAHLTFDTGSADPDALKDEVADAIGPVVEAQLRMLQHHHAGHDMPVTVTVYEVQDADELAHQLALLHGALAEAKAKRACSLPSVLRPGGEG